jgi:hypothetical protein
MTIVEKSMASSKLQDSFMVSITLNNLNKKAKNQAMAALGEKKKDQSDSFNN